MSQQQQSRPSQSEKQPIKYGDVFPVAGQLASKPIAPKVAATLQSAENIALGETQKGRPAALMQSAANKNERAGFVGHDEITDVAKDKGVSVTKTELPGGSVIIEAVGDQIVGEYAKPEPAQPTFPASAAVDRRAITIGEALQAAALSAGNKPIDQSDASAIQAAEMRATGNNEVSAGGLAATAQTAVTSNRQMIFEEQKIKISDVLTDATAKLADDKPVTREDAEGVISAEIKNNPDKVTFPGGVAASVAAAARLNQSKR